MISYRASRKDILKETEGMLQRQFYVVFTRPREGGDHLIDEVTPAHLAHQMQIEREGILVAAGPFWTEDETAHLGEGMFILRAASMEEARRICESDPMHSSGAREYTVRPWLLNEGSLTFRVCFSDQRMHWI